MQVQLPTTKLYICRGDTHSVKLENIDKVGYTSTREELTTEEEKIKANLFSMRL